MRRSSYLKEDAKSHTLSISDSIAESPTHNIYAIELQASFLPNVSYESGVARLVAKEDKKYN